MENEHRIELEQAKRLLTSPSVASKMTSMLGSSVDWGVGRLPSPVRDRVGAVTTKSLDYALSAALFTLGDNASTPSNRLHKASVAISGAAGGAFGLAALSVELPVSTTIILRSIADIARSEGEDLQLPITKLACLEVLALGTSDPGDDAAETGYFVMRAALAKAVTEAASFISTQGVSQTGAPALVRLVSQVAARFSIPVSQKVLAQSIPAIGAAGGAILNTLFMDHFQGAAKGHFVVRRLERKYGTDVVRMIYDEIPATQLEPSED